MATNRGVATYAGHIVPLVHKASEIKYTDTQSVQDALDALGSSTTVNVPVSSTVEVGDFVYQDGTGNVLRARGDNVRYRAFGLCVAKPTTTTAIILISGAWDGFTGLTPGDIYYLHPTILGGITPVQPAQGSGLWAKYTGEAITSEIMIVNCARPAVFRTP